MKTKLKRISRRSLAMILCVLMMLSTFMVAGISTANAASITSDGNAILYFNMGAVSWWSATGNFAYFWGDNGDAWSAKAERVTGNYYYVKIPAGTWENVILTRNSVTSSPGWGNKYNQTDNITLQAGKNYISAFSENSSTATWGTYSPDSAAALSASSTSTTTGNNVTLTPGISSNTTYNVYKKVDYSIDPSTGATISGNTFTATTPGDYTVTATVTYNAKGFTSIEKTAESSVTISVSAASNPVCDSVTLSADPSTVYADDAAADGVTLTAVPEGVIDGATYTFKTGNTVVAEGTEPTCTVYPTETTSYTVTVSLDGYDSKESSVCTVTVNERNKMYIVGDFQGWSLKTDLMSYDRDNECYYFDLPLTAGQECKFKIAYENGGWSNAWGGPSGEGNKLEFSRTAQGPKAATSHSSSSDCIFKADQAGTYRIKFKGTLDDDGSFSAGTIEVTYPDVVKYDVTVSANTGGKVQVGSGEASTSVNTKVGNGAVTIKAVPNSGYVFDGWEKTGEVTIANASNAETTITATAAGTVRAKFVQVYSVTVLKGSNGIVSFTSNPTNLTTLRAGTSVTITANLSSGWLLDNWVGLPSDATVNGNSVTFTVNGNISITCNAKQLPFNISVADDIVGGQVTVSRTTAYTGEKYIVSVTPAPGAQLKTLKANAGVIQPDTEISMPGRDVVISAEFEAIPPTITAGNISIYANGGTGTITASTDYGTIAYSTTDTSKITVDSNGLVTAVAKEVTTATVKLSATNTVEGLGSTTSNKNVIVTINLTSAQVAYNDLKDSFNNYGKESSSDYYDGNKWNAYAEAVSAASSLLTAFPAVSDTNADQYTAAKAALENAYDEVQSDKKSTTIYVLSKYHSSSEIEDNQRYVRVNMWDQDDTNGFSVDKKTYSSTNDTDFSMKLVGKVTVGTETKYLYSLSYTGKAGFIIFAAATRTGAFGEGVRRLTGDVENISEYGTYFFDRADSTTSTSKTYVTGFKKLGFTTNNMEGKTVGQSVDLTQLVNTSSLTGTLKTTSNAAITYKYFVEGIEVTNPSSYTIDNTSTNVKIIATVYYDATDDGYKNSADVAEKTVVITAGAKLDTPVITLDKTSVVKGEAITGKITNYDSTVTYAFTVDGSEVSVTPAANGTFSIPTNNLSVKNNIKLSVVASKNGNGDSDAATKTFNVTTEKVTINFAGINGNSIKSYTVKYTEGEVSNKSKTITANSSLSVDKNSQVTVTVTVSANSTGEDTSIVHHWVLAGVVQNTANKTYTFTADASKTVEAVAYGGITVSEHEIENSYIQPSGSTTVSVEMGKQGDKSGASTYYKAVVSLVDTTTDNVAYTFESDKIPVTAGAKYVFDNITISDVVNGKYKVEAEIFGYANAEDADYVAYGKSDVENRYLNVVEDLSVAKAPLTPRISVDSIGEGKTVEAEPGKEVTLRGYTNAGNKAAGNIAAQSADQYKYDFYYYTDTNSTPKKVGGLTLTNVPVYTTTPVSYVDTKFVVPAEAPLGTKYIFYAVVTAYKDGVAISDACSTLDAEGAVTLEVSRSYKVDAYKGQAVAWVDALPSYSKGSTSTLIKWTNRITGQGDDNSTDNYNGRTRYTFYLPSTVDFDNVHFYHDLSSISISGVNNNSNIASGDVITVEPGKTYNATIKFRATGTVSNGCSVRFMKGSSSSSQLYLDLTDISINNQDTPESISNLPMVIQPGDSDGMDPKYNHKDDVQAEGGTTIAVKDGTYEDSYAIKKFKGRGNSSWAASVKFYGKYAYNLTLSSQAKLLGLTGSNSKGTTKYSLLANNVDESQTRNSYAYKLAKELGFEYYPSYKMADMYSNGVYLGSYLVCQKVELGKKQMITEPEIKNEQADGNDPATSHIIKNDGSEVSESYADEHKNELKYRYWDFTDGTAPANEGTYQLEFELDERFLDEASWFVSNQGQHICLNSPEFATKDQIEFIYEKWNEVEDKVYAGKLDDVRDKIDVESFAKMYLIQELSKNLDTGATSYNVLYKCDDGKFYAEPAWDFDWTFGQYRFTKSIKTSAADANNDPSKSYGWFARYKYIYNKNGTYNFQAKLCDNASFWADVQTIWKNEFHTKATSNLDWLKQYHTDIKDTVEMNEARWKFIANDPTSDWGSTDTGSKYSEAAEWLEDWITARINWIDSKIGSTTYTISAGTDATMTYLPNNMENGLTAKYTQFAPGAKLTFTAENKSALGYTFQGWSTDGTNVDPALGTTRTIKISADKSATYTPIYKINYPTATKPVTFYVDMHADDIAPTINFASGNTLALSRVGDSTVYSGSIDIVYYDNNGTPVGIKSQINNITADGKTFPVKTKLAVTCVNTGKVWLEATKNIKTASPVNTTAQSKGKTNTSVSTKRVYFVNNKNWSTVNIYCWKVVNNSDVVLKSWPGSAMNLAGTNSGGKKVYYFDIPAANWEKVIFNNGSIQTQDITLSANYSTTNDNTYYLNETKNDKQDDAELTTPSKSPVFTRYASKLEAYVGDNNYNIKPEGLDSSVEINYNSSDVSVATVDDNGNVTAVAKGTAKITITATGSNGDVYSKETEVIVTERPAAGAAYDIISYKSNTATFSAQNGTVSKPTVVVNGAFGNPETIVTEENGVYTVEYACADTATTNYAGKYSVNISVTSQKDGDGYKFAGWTKNGTLTEQGESISVLLGKTPSTYVAKYLLDTVKMVVKYNFRAYDDATNGFALKHDVSNPDKYTVASSFTTAPIDVHINDAVAAVKSNAPSIMSNYYTYTLNDDSINVSASPDENGVYQATATLTHAPRKYSVVVNGTLIKEAYFQNEVNLSANDLLSNTTDTSFIWKDTDNKNLIVCDKDTYTLRVSADVNLLVAVNDGSETLDGKSVIRPAHHEIVNKEVDGKEDIYVGQNFYIQNFFRKDTPVTNANGEVVSGATNKTFEGAGVLYYITNNDKISSTTVNRYLNRTHRSDKIAGIKEAAARIGTSKTIRNGHSVEETSGLYYSFVKNESVVDDLTSMAFMKYSNTQGCYHYFFEPFRLHNSIYAKEKYHVYSYYAYSYMLNGKKVTEYVISDGCAVANAYYES